MRRIRLQFSPMGQRWSVDVVGADDRVADIVEEGLLTIARDDRALVTSIVIDTATPGPDVLDLVAEEFGREIADRLTGPASDEIDEVFVIGDDPGSGVVRGESPRARAALVLLSGEPGVPTPVDGDRYRMLVEIGTRSVEGSVERDLVEPLLRIDIDVAVTTDQLWVRVAEGETGAILALAPLRSSQDAGRSEVEIAFGLAVPMQTLHFSVSDEPLRDPGERSDRRSRWARDLEGRASARARRLRADASSLFEQAADVHANLGDLGSAERCVDAARRARRRRRFFGGTTLVLAAVAFSMAGLMLGRSDEQSIPPVDAAPVTTIVAPGPTLPDVPPQAGPIDVIFDDDREAQLLITSDVILKPGDRLEFVVRTRIRSAMTFERLQDCIGAEGGNSVFGGDGPMYQPTFIPVLTHATDLSAGSRAFPPFLVDRSIDTYFVLPGACSESWVQDGQRFDAKAIAVYTPFTVRVTLPDDLEAGAWKLSLVLENTTGTSADGTYPTVRVEG